METPVRTMAPEKLRAPPGRFPRRGAGLVLILLAGLLLAGSAVAKFAGVPGVLRQMAAAGFAGPKLTLVASLEIASALLFLLPRTRSVGLLLASAYLGGAICTHVQAGEYARALPSSTLLALAWTGAALRHRQVLWSLSGPGVRPSFSGTTLKEGL